MSDLELDTVAGEQVAAPMVEEPKTSVNLDGCPITTYRAAMAWACDLGFRDAGQGSLQKSSRQVMESYPFTGQVGHETGLHHAYLSGRFHHNFSTARIPGKAAPSYGENARGSSIVVNRPTVAGQTGPINIAPNRPEELNRPTLTKTINPVEHPLGRPVVVKPRTP